MKFEKGAFKNWSEKKKIGPIAKYGNRALTNNNI